jgi:ABC-type nitrate/sulfonate/bicarbonate transport system ATPase subunit
MITFENVSKSFNHLRILANISFNVRVHDVVAIQGVSGSGKTTILKLIAGILKPDSGTVRVPVSKIGFIFQDHRLLPWKSALDNIVLVLRSTGCSDEEAREKAKKWMDKMGLAKFYDYFPAQLSGGMIQRVSIARAFAIEPEIMLMDEPFSSLDTELSASLIRELGQVLSEYKTTTLYVTHDHLQALSLASRIFQLENGFLKEITVTDRKAMALAYLNKQVNDILRPD